MVERDGKTYCCANCAAVHEPAAAGVAKEVTHVRTETKTQIYAGVDSPQDIRTINAKIRNQMERTDSREEADGS
jgi:hypothetical protein